MCRSIFNRYMYTIIDVSTGFIINTNIVIFFHLYLFFIIPWWIQFSKFAVQVPLSSWCKEHVHSASSSWAERQGSWQPEQHLLPVRVGSFQHDPLLLPSTIPAIIQHIFISPPNSHIIINYIKIMKLPVSII